MRRTSHLLRPQLRIVLTYAVYMLNKVGQLVAPPIIIHTFVHYALFARGGKHALLAFGVLSLSTMFLIILLIMEVWVNVRQGRHHHRMRIGTWGWLLGVTTGWWTYYFAI